MIYSLNNTIRTLNNWGQLHRKLTIVQTRKQTYLTWSSLCLIFITFRRSFHVSIINFTFNHSASVSNRCLPTSRHWLSLLGSWLSHITYNAGSTYFFVIWWASGDGGCSNFGSHRQSRRWRFLFKLFEEQTSRRHSFLLFTVTVIIQSKSAKSLWRSLWDKYFLLLFTFNNNIKFRVRTITKLI